MIRIKAPDEAPVDRRRSVFLAGSIDNGEAEKWQDRFCEALQNEDLLVFDPRRDEWNTEPSEEELNKQIQWELTHINQADLVVFYFAPKSIAPITLLELGIVAEGNLPAVVCCPKEYWRSGNVHFICNYYDITLVESFDELIEEVLRYG